MVEAAEAGEEFESQAHFIRCPTILPTDFFGAPRFAAKWSKKQAKLGPACRSFVSADLFPFEKLRVCVQVAGGPPDSTNDARNRPVGTGRAPADSVSAGRAQLSVLQSGRR